MRSPRPLGLVLIVFVILVSVFSLVVTVPAVPLTIAANRLLLVVLALGCLLAVT